MFLSNYLSTNLSISIYLSIYLCICLYIYVCLYLSFQLSPFLSIYLFSCLSIYLTIHPSSYLSTYLPIYLSIYLFILCTFTYVNGQVNNMFVILCEMWFEDYRSKIMLQKTLLNQRKRICYLNLNWWNNLNLILTSSNSWDALPNLVGTEMFIISFRPYFSHTQDFAHCSQYRLH